ncbi:aminotransferase class I/II-fold pyridoxal phosphate-dependent enzyme [Leucobacter sp. M11]|uniref:aminotransferase class I/II-fold pyridoxal phosphate-dependent enzyme n=1 Tax=Leucobacter sp. M11 TaxID=2993565 RepID=UPI002D7F85AE|nr:ornithine decarboxylase [Leucobacter sp. M11]MEB4614658.1 aminotransferase class I/II-fold pyridoxal phosphate-dependent enzyme [Leucobacter sp. M11]
MRATSELNHRGADPGIPASVWRLRSDAWEYLRYAVKLLTLDQGASWTDTNRAEIHRSLRTLEAVELYWAGFGQRYVSGIRDLIDGGEYPGALELIERVMLGMRGAGSLDEERPTGESADEDGEPTVPERRPRFEVLIVDEMAPTDRDALKAEMLRMRQGADEFVYELVIVPSFEDALVAVITNPNIQACVLRPGFTANSKQKLGRDLRGYLDRIIGERPDALHALQRVLRLAEALGELRPELDLFLVAGVHIEDLAGTLNRRFRRVFRREDRMELHLSLLRGVRERYATPFFSALQEYARMPAGVFHALPISRGGSVSGSKWIGDMGDFYGKNLLLAETSATSGGLDSLLSPVGSIKDAQTRATRAFGAKKTVFVTGGTSTANKIVHQSIVAPGDVVLVDRNCHKSHHHALMLAGARVAYLEAYPLNEYSFYGAVPVRSIKQTLLDYRAAGRLDEVKMIALTNCTFDGIVYDVERVMSECLAIKPDLVFLWDEAWFAFAAFHPVFRRRTGMATAARLEAQFRSGERAEEFRAQRAELVDPDTGAFAPDEAWLDARLIPDPETSRVRVYATQSTHKTLTSLRQGSMIHVYDQDFQRLNREAFDEAYMTHTSTSPNYQILASLDIGRRQVEFEGYELVQRQMDLATSIAQTVARHPLLKKYFRVLTTRDLVPEAYRETDRPMPLRDGLASFDEAWARDEFVVDPSRVTVDISLTGVDGDTFKHDYLMDRHGIQVNKTSRNTVLFMTNIGTSRGSVAYLIEVLVKLAEAFEDEEEELGPFEQRTRKSRKDSVAVHNPPLPDFSAFADRFRAHPDTPDGTIRDAYFATYRAGSTEYLHLEPLLARVLAGEELVSAGFVTPYPPGFPVLVPGQVITTEILAFMGALDTREIHGYDPEAGFRVLVAPPEPGEG